MEDGHNQGFPTLPPGYHEQPASSFRDSAGRVYELHHVYGRPAVLGDRGPVSFIDEGLSFWSVTASANEGNHWLSYAEARTGRRPRLTFERFTSPGEMRARLPGLLQVGESA